MALAGLWDPLLPAAPLPCVDDRHCWQAAAVGCRGSDASAAGVLPGASNLCPSHCYLFFRVWVGSMCWAGKEWVEEYVPGSACADMWCVLGGIRLSRMPRLHAGMCWSGSAWPACFGCMLAGVWCMCWGCAVVQELHACVPPAPWNCERVSVEPGDFNGCDAWVAMLAYRPARSLSSSECGFNL